MKRILCFLLALAMISPLVSAAADVPLTSTGTGYENVPFSNGYLGFCLDRDLKGAYPGDRFVSAGSTNSAASNVGNRENISQVLKALFTQCFEDIFRSDGNGGYAPINANLIQAVVWHFTEGQYVWGDSKALADQAKAYNGPAIPDEGYQITLQNGDVITFSFVVIQPVAEGVQDFFAYQLKVTQAGAHTHAFGDEWKHNDTQHWQECACGEKQGVADHLGGTADCKNQPVCSVCETAYGQTDSLTHTGNTELRGQLPASQDAPGYTGDTHCTDCGALLEAGEPIPQLHTHAFGEEWKHNDTQHWQECACGETQGVADHLGGTADCKNQPVCSVCETAYGQTNSLTHTGNTELRGQLPASQDAPGYTGDTHCADCGALLEAGEPIPQLHTHAFGEEWKHNDAQHWQECACGEKQGVADHLGGTADCKNQPVCAVCETAYGQTDSLTHTGNTELRGQLPASQDAPGYTGDTHCTDCGALLEAGEPIPQLHTHAFGEEWKHNDTQHWQECACGEKQGVADHLGGTADCKNQPVCSVCETAYGQTDSLTHTGNTELRGQLPASQDAPGYTGDTHCTDCGALLEAGEPIPQLHTHAFGDEWKHNDTQHWQECACGETQGVAAHSYQEGKCSVCGAEQPQSDYVPETGDRFDLWQMMLLLAVSGAALCFGVAKRRAF